MLEASVTAALLLSEEDVGGVGDEGSTNAEVTMEEKSTII